MPNTTDLIGLAIDKNPIDFANALDQIMMQKASDALDAYKVDLAKSVYGASEADPEDDFDFNTHDLDLDDFDDLNLDDIDLEDLTDGQYK